MEMREIKVMKLAFFLDPTYLFAINKGTFKVVKI